MKKGTLAKASTASKGAAKKQSVISVTPKAVPSSMSKTPTIVPTLPLPGSEGELKAVLSAPTPTPTIPIISEHVIETPVPADVHITPTKSIDAPNVCTDVAQSSPVQCVAAPVLSSCPDESLVAHDPPRDGMTETPVASGTNPDSHALAHKTPSPSQLDQSKEASPLGVNFASRSYRAVVDKYSLGLHTVKRSNIQLGPNTRVVTIPGIMKVVKSIRAQGYITGVNTPVVVFNTTDARFADIDVVRKTPSLIEEIVQTGTLLCDAGQHRELAFRYLEQADNKLPTDLPVPSHQEVEILLNVQDDYDFFVIGKKHNKVTQAQNNEHITDFMKQVGTMWEKVTVLGGKRSRVVMSDAYRLNCSEFGPDDMGPTKFASYFSFYQTFTQKFKTQLEVVTREVGADVMPSTAMEALVKFLKQPEMKGRPILAGQLQLESLNYFERWYTQCGEKTLSSKLYETVIMPYLVMILTMQQVAIDLLPDNEGEYQMPESVSKYFQQHLHNLEVGPNGVAFAQDFYTTHVTYWQESRGYLPAELKKTFTVVQQPPVVANRLIEAPPVVEAELSSVKKSKAAIASTNEPPRKSARLEVKERKTYHDVDMDVQEQEDGTDATTSEREDEESREDVECSSESDSMETSEIDTIGEVYSWAVPTEQELERCASAWVSGGSLEAEQVVEELPEQVESKRTWVNVHGAAFLFSEHSDLIPTNCSFIVLDYRHDGTSHSVSNDEIFAKLSFVSDHLCQSGCAIFVPPLHDLSRLNSLLEDSQSTLKLKRDGASYIHYYLYNVAADSRIKTQNLVVPYILAFKGAVSPHTSYTIEEGIKPANTICASNEHPSYTNIVSGFDSSERFFKIYEPGSSKVTPPLKRWFLFIFVWNAESFVKY